MDATTAPPIPAGHAVCPKCNGTTRRPYDYTHDPSGKWRKGRATYRESDDTLACDNCGGQTMSLQAKGHTRIDPATGLGCMHNYVGRDGGRCYTVYTCAKCGSGYDIDSSD
jgi:hypothetical protein